MNSRMDKYKTEDTIPTRSDKNKALYKQVYNAYDEFENLIVPSNAREINPHELKKEIKSRQDYHKQRDIENITNSNSNNSVIRKEKITQEQKQEEEIYDINELLNKATSDNKKPELITATLSNEDYLKRLKLDNRRTNIEQVKEIYDNLIEENAEEDETLMKTANLSLEILSDLKGDNDKTFVSEPIKTEELPEDLKEIDFYSDKYKFSKKDFEDKEINNEEDEEDEDFEEEESGGGKFFFKILLLIFGIILIILGLIYFMNYLNRV